MNTIVTENRNNKNSSKGKWTPFREGLVFKEFLDTFKDGDYEVDNELIKKVSDETTEILSKCIDPNKNDLDKKNM